MADGVVTKVYFSDSYGNVVEYETNFYNKRLTFFMAHLEEGVVKEGQFVKKGDVVGLAGNTGQSTGPHLHFSLYADGELINPLYGLEVGNKKEVINNEND